jgi:hypothetical protein
LGGRPDHDRQRAPTAICAYPARLTRLTESYYWEIETDELRPAAATPDFHALSPVDQINHRGYL